MSMQVTNQMSSVLESEIRIMPNQTFSIQYTVPMGDVDELNNSYFDPIIYSNHSMQQDQSKQSRQNTKNQIGESNVLKVDLNFQNKISSLQLQQDKEDYFDGKKDDQKSIYNQKSIKEQTNFDNSDCSSKADQDQNQSVLNEIAPNCLTNDNLSFTYNQIIKKSTFGQSQFQDQNNYLNPNNFCLHPLNNNQGQSNQQQKGDKNNVVSVLTSIIPNSSVQNSLNQAFNQIANKNNKTKINVNSISDRHQYRIRKDSDSFLNAILIIQKQLKASSTRQFRIDELVKKFIKLLQRSYSKKSTGSLTLPQHQIINDSIDFTQKHIHNSTFMKYLAIFLQKIDKSFNEKIFIKVFMPSHTFKLFWDTFQIIFHFIFFYVFSIYLFFSQNEIESDFLNKIYEIFIIQLILDILIVLNTAFYLQDQIITNRTQIFKNYMNNSLGFDILSLVCSLIVSINSKHSFVYNPDHSMKFYLMNIFIFARGVGVSQKKGGFDMVQTMSTSQRHLLRLFNQLIFMITFAHILGIFWYLLGLFQEIQKTDTNWLLKYEISQYDWYSKYLYSLYWSVTTMTTVGYGDITPSNYIEALFNTISMILFSCVFAYSINNVGMILQDIEKGSVELKNNIITMQRYLGRRNVNSELRSRIKNYLYFLASETRERNRSAEEGVIQLLSNKLRDELTVEVNTKMIRLCAIFDKLFSQQTLSKLIYAIQEIQVSPNEIIFSQNEIRNQAIYFILDGQIEIYSELAKKKTVYKILSSNSYFGEYSFFSGISRRASARSVNLSTLCYLPREEFLTIIKTNHEDYQRYKQLSEQISVLGDISVINLVGCFTCGQLDHYSLQCPKTHLQLDKQFVILKHNYFEYQERSFYQRKLKYNKLTQFALNLVQDNQFYSIKLIKYIEQIGGDIYDRIQIYARLCSEDLYKSNQYTQNSSASVSDSGTEEEDDNDDEEEEDYEEDEDEVDENNINDTNYSKQKSKREPIYEYQISQQRFRDNIEQILTNESQNKIKKSSKQDKPLKARFSIQLHPLQYDNVSVGSDLNIFEGQQIQRKSENNIVDNSSPQQKRESKNSNKIQDKKNVYFQDSFDSDKQGEKQQESLLTLLENAFIPAVTDYKKLPSYVFKDGYSSQKSSQQPKNKSMVIQEQDEDQNTSYKQNFKRQSSQFSKNIHKKLEPSSHLEFKDYERTQQSPELNRHKQIIQLTKNNFNRSSMFLQGIMLDQQQERDKNGFIQQNTFEVSLKKGNSITASQSLAGIKAFEQFDQVYIFSKFFPHNNITNILTKLKIKKNQLPKPFQKVTPAVNLNRRERNFDIMQKHLQNFVVNQQINSPLNNTQNYAQLYNPTVISYGINTVKSMLYPIKQINDQIYY